MRIADATLALGLSFVQDSCITGELFTSSVVDIKNGILYICWVPAILQKKPLNTQPITASRVKSMKTLR